MDWNIDQNVTKNRKIINLKISFIAEVMFSVISRRLFTLKNENSKFIVMSIVHPIISIVLTHRLTLYVLKICENYRQNINLYFV